MSTSPAWNRGFCITRARNGIVVVTPSMMKLSSAICMRVIASVAVAPLADELREQRIVVRRHRVAGVDVRVEAHAGAAGRMEHVDAAPATAGSCARDPRRSRGTRSRARAAAASSCTLSFSPAATRICSFTRSTPVIISVTGCSTWMRVFISMK